MKRWHYFLIAVLAGCLAGAGVHAATSPAASADNESVGNDQMGLFRADGAYALRVTSSGHVVGGSDNQIDLGSPVRGLRNVYIGDTGTLNYAGTTYAASSGTTIPVTGTRIVLTSTGAGFNMTQAIPTFNTSNARDGDLLIVESATGVIIMNDRKSVSGTAIALNASTLTFQVGDVAEFIYSASTGAWLLKSFTDNR